MVQFIEGAGEALVNVLAGPAETTREGQTLLDSRWHLSVDRLADTVVAAVAGDPTHHGFAELARALACAARVVRPNGRIILLTGANPTPGRAMEILRQSGDPQRGLELLRGEETADMAAAFQWAHTVQQTTVYILSQLPGETAEELFTTPLEDASQLQRLLNVAGSYLILDDADKTLAVPPV
jgi:hypothetical protein